MSLKTARHRERLRPRPAPYDHAGALTSSPPSDLTTALRQSRRLLYVTILATYQLPSFRRAAQQAGGEWLTIGLHDGGIAAFATHPIVVVKGSGVCTLRVEAARVAAVGEDNAGAGDGVGMSPGFIGELRSAKLPTPGDSARPAAG
jgi:hypothetical protein